MEAIQGQNLTNLLQNLASNVAFEKLASGRSQAVTVEEAHEMLVLFNVAKGHDDDDQLGIVNVVVFQAVLEQALQEGETRDNISRAITFAQRSQHIGDTMTAADFVQVLLLGSPHDVKMMSAKLHGLDIKTSFVLRESLINYLHKRKEQSDNCKAMPVTLIFFSLIFYMVTSHLSIPLMYELNDSVGSIKSKDIAKKFPGVFWKHFDGFIGSPYIAHNNQILGGIRVSRKSAEGKPDGPLCQYGPWNYLWDEIRTGGKASDEPAPLKVCHKVTTPASWLHWTLRPEDALLRFNTGLRPKSFCEGLKATVNSTVNSSVPDRLKSILNRTDCSVLAPSALAEIVRSSTGEQHRPRWYSRRIGTLQLQAVTHNRRVGFYVFKHIQVNVQESGAVKVSHVVESFTDSPVWMRHDEDLKQGRLAVIIVDLVFLFFYLYTGVALLYNVFRTLRHRHFWAFLKDIWVKVEILNIFLVFMIILGYFHCVHLTAGLNLLKDALPAPPENNGVIKAVYNTTQWETYAGRSMDTYEEDLHSVLDQASRVAQSFKDLRWYVTVFCFCSCVRFLKVFRANEKLNVVGKTITYAGSDLLHFLMVFMALCMAFVLVIHVLCGSQIDQFADLGVAINTVLLFLLGYVFDDVWKGMLESGNKLAIIWSVLFMILMVLISLNMVLAIIFDVYAEVKSAAENDPALWEQVAAFWREGKKKSDAKVTGKEPGESGAQPGENDDFSNSATEGTRRSRPEAAPEDGGGWRNSLHDAVEEFKHDVEVLEEEVEHAAQVISTSHLENKMLDALRIQDLHPECVVTTDSLLDAMKLHPKMRDNIEELILAAAENSEYENQVQEMSMTNNLRLIQRIDQNLRDLVRLDRIANLKCMPVKTAWQYGIIPPIPPPPRTPEVHAWH